MFLLKADQFPAEILEQIRYRDLVAGEALYHRGDRSEFVFSVQKGRLQLLSYTSDGNPVTIYVVRAGECVSEAALFAECCCSDVIAETKTRVMAVPKKLLLDTLRKDPQLSEEFMAMLARRFNAVRVRLELRGIHSARERVMQYLKLSVPSGGDAMVLDRPLRFIAEDLGLARETLYRTLSELEKDGSISRKHRSIIVGGHHPEVQLTKIARKNVSIQKQEDDRNHFLLSAKALG